MKNRTFDDNSFKVLSRNVWLAQEFVYDIHDAIDRTTDLLSSIAEILEKDNE